MTAFTKKLALIAMLSLIPLAAKAADGMLFFSSGHGVYEKGKVYTTRLMVNSGGGAGINAIKSEFRFDPKLIQVKAVRKDKSIFILWPEEVKFDNKKGTLSFTGGTPTAYKQGAGKLLDIDFTLLAKATTSIDFASSTVLSAEVSPKNVLKDMRSANFTIGSTAQVNAAKALAQKMSGCILLQVQSKGEAWYVYPKDYNKYYLGRPSDAFNIMRQLGMGVKHSVITGNKVFPAKLSGMILIDVEDSGKAYYIYPPDRKAYYLGRPADAFRIMREKGLGTSNETIFKIKDWVI